MSEWLPIESAPKDGTDILAVFKDSTCMIVVSFDASVTSCYVWRGNEGRYREDVLAYWMPLPSPPKLDR